MATMIERMLELAEDQINRYPNSGVARRRAVSSAYYATFHALMELCADSVLPARVDVRSEVYARVYRTVDHGPMKKAFQGQVLREQASLRAIGDSIIELQSARVKADYLPAGYQLAGQRSLTLAEARQRLTQARRTIDKLDDLDDDDRLILAVHLLFKDRPKD